MFANMVIPTAQNLANLETDHQAYLPLLDGMDDESLSRQMQLLVRAYDPCISCATHYHPYTALSSMCGQLLRGWQSLKIKA